MRSAKLLQNSRLIQKFSDEEQWSKRSIVLRLRRAGRTFRSDELALA
jgi:hypothetical protein